MLFAQRDAVDGIYARGECGKELIALGRQYVALEAGNQNGNAVALHRAQGFQHATENLLYFAEWCLVVVKCFQQAEDHRRARTGRT